MQKRIRGHIRSNVVGYIALFFALSGGAAWATHPGGANTIDSTDIIDDQVKSPDIRDGNVTRDDIRTGAVVTEHIDTGAVQSIDVLNNSLTDADIQNPTRSVNLPLPSFWDSGAASYIDFDTTNSLFSPDFSLVSNNLVIEFDPDSGGEDVASFLSTFAVPPDYASGGSLALWISKEAHTAGETEHVFCAVSVNGEPASSAGSAEITTDALIVYTLTPSAATFSAGASVGLECFVSPQNDYVRLHSFEFRYTATQ
jgi:hypothetical protein